MRCARFSLGSSAEFRAARASYFLSRSGPVRPGNLLAHVRGPLQRRLSGFQLRTLLGIPSRWDLDALLKERQVYDYTIEDFDKDLASIRELREKQKADCLA
jgi:Uncharacterised protein family (UPF0175)